MVGNNDFVQKIAQIVSMRMCRIATELEGNGSGWIIKPHNSKRHSRIPTNTCYGELCD